MEFKRSLVKLVAVLSLFFTGASLINVPNLNQSQTVQAASKKGKRNAVAKKQVGKPYVYGATGPFAFDCSGLAQYVYKKAALLFWGSTSFPYHVGIYVGDGKYVHAATPGQGVKKQAISMYFYPSAAKRVL
ncbi:NlpC/P60 family protein [Lactobacillus helveticus]|uniref:C40 family peptidase n=1 Tax=Lactobacillus helveticus TaxID=1587 RepID=UPI001C64E92C|nr:NlpC/P60 family protein [Lactobacillus helveticus]MBW7986149.1 NlpC/P60 family protein [Lactobacillus helveticus]MBW8037842.1 NlpC/P60 family protein [Lactobacillus helveticus]